MRLSSRATVLFPRILVAILAIATPMVLHAESMAEQVMPVERPIDITDESYETGVVTDIFRVIDDDYAGYEHKTQKVKVRIESGKHKGEEFDMDNGILNDRADMYLSRGQKIVVNRMEKSDGSVKYLMRDRYRIPALIWLAIIFVIFSALTGGIRGLTSIFGLVVSVLILVKGVIPAIVAGQSPLLVCLVGAYLIAVTSLYLAHGFHKRTSIALLSTCITLGLSAILAVIFVQTAQLFGMGSEESMFLQTGQFANIDLRGLLLGGIIIGALGVLDDITTAQTAAIDEISKANPAMTFAQLYASGMSVGREHIASLINTLALAYVGASLPLLLLFQEGGDMPTWMIINGEFIAEEIIRTLVGSSALLLAVPISTWFAATLLRNRTGKVQKSEGGHGHRH